MYTRESQQCVCCCRLEVDVVMYSVEVTFAVADDDCSKDVRLPVQMQRAMAAEAEATREAKAKV